MNKDFKEALEIEADNYGFQVPYDGTNNFYDDKKIKCFTDGAEWAYTYLQKEGGKDLVTGVRQEIAQEIAQWVINNRNTQPNGERMTDTEMFHILCDKLNSEQAPERSIATELNSSTEPLPNKELSTLDPEQRVQDYEIEKALLATLVIDNIRGIPFAINKLRQLFKNKQP